MQYPPPLNAASAAKAAHEAHRLGATGRSLIGLVFGTGMRLAIAGIGAGVICASAATRMLQARLYGVPPNDSLTFASITAAMLIVALLAGVGPARRALRVYPMRSLRAE